MRLPLAQILQQGAVQVLAAAVPFIIVPIVSRAATSEGWSSFVIGQAVGGFAGIVTSYGWPVAGISEIARVKSHERAALGIQSVSTRLIVFVPTAILSLLVLAFIIKPESLFTSAAVGIGLAAASGLSFAWYFIGIGDVRRTALYAVGPMFLASIATVVVLLLGMDPGWYGIFLCVFTAASIFLFLRAEVRIQTREAATGGIAAAVKRLKSYLPVAASQWVYAIYMALPMMLAGAVLLAGDAAIYATADRVVLIAATALASAANVLQVWTSTEPSRDRIVLATSTTAGAGAVGAVLMWLWGVELTEILFGRAHRVDETVAQAVALFTLAFGVRTALMRYVLVPAGRYRLALVSSGVGLVILCVMYFVVNPLSPGKIAWSLAVAETAAMIATTVLSFSKRSFSSDHEARRSLGST